LSKRDQSTAIHRKPGRNQLLTCSFRTRQETRNMSTSIKPKMRPWANGLFGVAAFAAMSANTAAAPISTMTTLTSSEALPVTKVAERQHRTYHAHQARQVRRFYGAAGSVNQRPNSEWHDLDSNNLPFGSREWWDQHWTDINGH